MKSQQEAIRALELYGDMVRRICFMHLRNDSDVQDVFQEVFLKYVQRDEPFESGEHEKAWLIRVAVNACNDLARSFFRKHVFSLEEASPDASSFDEENREVLDAVLRLPPKYRDVVYLHYYEGYPAVEIAKMLGKNENTIYTWLARARSTLKTTLGGEGIA